MKYALLVLLTVASLYGLHRLGLWAEGRGWLYYRKKHGSSGTLASALLEVHSLLEPSKRHVVEERKRDQVEDEGSGIPPDHGRWGAPSNNEADEGPRMASQSAALVADPRVSGPLSAERLD
jgi:hypothetical protein